MKRIVIMVLALMAAAPAFAAGPLESKAQTRFYGAKFDSVHEYDVQRYTMWIGLPFINDSLYGRVRINAASRQNNLGLLSLNAVDMTIDSVRCDGRDTTFSYDGTTLTVDLPGYANGKSFGLDVFYRLGGRGSNRLGYYWYPQGYNSGTLHAIAYSMSEPQDARYWVPCFDEPWDKADSGCVFFVTVPDSYSVASNGLLQDTSRNGDQVTWHWSQPDPIATYLMCFTASRFTFWSDTVHTINAGAVPLNYFQWPEDSAASRAVFATVPGMVRLFDSLFHAYPFDKYGMAAAYPFGFGGMEHQTMTTIHRNWITGNSQVGIVHELAHMWYGDLVTCGGWANIWLNEGFASYLEAVYDEHLNSRAPGIYMKQRFWPALSYASVNTYPIYDPPSNLLFDWPMEYCKGAWVLQGLRGVMGDGAFFPMMRAYADSFAYGNAVSADYQRIAERWYGQPLDWFFNEWIHRAGHPKYATVTYYKTHPDSNAARVLIRQTSITGETYKMPLQLACSTRAGVAISTVWDSAASADYLVTDTLPILSVTLDRDSWVLKEWVDSLPHLSQLTVIGGTTVSARWNRFTADTTIAGYNLYRSVDSTGGYARINQSIIADTSFTDSNAVSCMPWYYYVTAVNGADTGYETHASTVLSCLTGGVSGHVAVEPPTMLSLGQNRPNPFEQSTMINYQLPAAGQVQLGVYNATGQLIRTLVNGPQRVGRHTAVWDGRDAAGREVASGVYYCRLETTRGKLTRAMQLVK